MRWIVGTLFLLACTRGPEASSDGSEPSPDVEVPPAPTLEAHVERFGPNASIATTDAGYDPTFDASRTRGRATNP